MNHLAAASFSNLGLGIREFFRIVIPGAYGAALFQFLAPESAFVVRMSRSTSSMLMAILVTGLVGYALRVHERWPPYYLVFEDGRKSLNYKIADLLGLSRERDHVHLYKYFLETKAPEMKERVHYFSSFYYMLTELSLFSFAAATALTLSFLLQLTQLVGQYKMGFFACSFVVAGLVSQTTLLRGRRSIRGTWEQTVALLGLLFLLLALGIAICASWAILRPKSLLDVAPEFQLLLLLGASVAFERLAAKQWEALVREQLVLVQDKRSELLKLRGIDTNA